MTKRLLTFALTLALLSVNGPRLLAADAPTELELRCRDSVTGRNVVPSSLKLDGQELAGAVDAHGRLSQDLAPGTYRVVAKAAGYRHLEARVTCLSGESADAVLLLDPATAPMELAPGTLQRLGSPDDCLLSGYVVEDDTGEPLEGAEIAAGSARALTDARGFFRCAVPIPGTQLVPGEARARLATVPVTVIRPGYVTQVWDQVLFTTGDSRAMRVRLSPGEGVEPHDASLRRGGLHAMLLGEAPADPQAEPAEPPAVQTESALESLQPAPTTIRVGRDCPKKTTCTRVEVMSIETYVKHVLPHEWYASWRADSLKAGAIAIRSYGGWHVYHPVAATYDICDTSACQVYKDGTDSRSDAAIDATAGIYMVDAAGNIGRAEYSAENNDKDGACGDCYTINNPNDSVCLSDDVCCDEATYGHGRGMCQWGSQRWARDRAKTYDWICDHYYAAYGWTMQTLVHPPPIITQHPSDQHVCPNSAARFTVAATGAGTLTYRWQKNGANLANGGHYAGVTTTTLTVSPADAGDVAAYRCVVTGDGGPAVSNSADLTLGALTTVTQHPQPRSLCPGGNATFTVAAAGEEPLTFRWQKDEADLAEGGYYSGTDSSMLLVSEVDITVAGAYRCRVTGACGSAVSNAAALDLKGDDEPVPGDFDGDRDVDQEDFGRLQGCLTGPIAAQTDPVCRAAMLDDNETVDDGDFTLFRKCFSGPLIRANPCCASP